MPPDFINEETSGDVMIPEGGTIKLTCRARGYPVPHVLWRREDGNDIIVREPNGQKTKCKYNNSLSPESVRSTRFLCSCKF